jgi:hypothetical protein
MTNYSGTIIPRFPPQGKTVLPRETEVRKGEINGPVEYRAKRGNVLGDIVYFADKYLGWIRPFNDAFNERNWAEKKEGDMTPPPEPKPEGGRYSGAVLDAHGVQMIDLVNPKRAYATFMENVRKLTRRGYTYARVPAGSLGDGIGEQYEKTALVADHLGKKQEIPTGGHELLGAILENEYRIPHSVADADKTITKYEPVFVRELEAGNTNAVDTVAAMIAKALTGKPDFALAY